MTIATIAKTGKNRLGPFGGGVCMRRNPFQIKASFQSYESDVFFASGVLRLRQRARHPARRRGWGAPAGGHRVLPQRVMSGCDGKSRNGGGEGREVRSTHRADGEPPRAGWGRILRV